MSRETQKDSTSHPSTRYSSFIHMWNAFHPRVKFLSCMKHKSFLHASWVIRLHDKHLSCTYHMSFNHILNIFCPYITCQSSTYQTSFVHTSLVTHPHIKQLSSTCHMSFFHKSNIFCPLVTCHPCTYQRSFVNASNIFCPHIKGRSSTPQTSFFHASQVIHPLVNSSFVHSSRFLQKIVFWGLSQLIWVSRSKTFWRKWSTKSLVCLLKWYPGFCATEKFTKRKQNIWSTSVMTTMKKSQPENDKDFLWCYKTGKLIHVKGNQNERISVRKC